ncbi:unnamed protein product [Rotaria sp. Silwood1]|nr:unnamed protein product [Rotaria sp. Silwood1]
MASTKFLLLTIMVIFIIISYTLLVQAGPIVEPQATCRGWGDTSCHGNGRFATKENACQSICHLHGSDVHGYTVKCGWGRDESNNTGNNVSNYGSGMNNQNYKNNQYDSVS